MDELEISGKRYISSVRAAKEHKYHSDYIGQLVRGGKVAGQKVGRAWYIDADSLAEYLGKEVPVRGPIVKKVNLEDDTKADVVLEDSEEKSLTPDDKEPEFKLPFRKSGRQHVIAAINSNVEVEKQEKKVEVAKPVEEEFVQESNSEPEAEAETFIPLKITKEVSEPEDSFYKISPRSLRYVSEPAALVADKSRKNEARISTHSLGKKNKLAALVRVAGVLAVAGVLSLGAGIAASYYLHSITTIGNSGQSSSIILSQ